MNSPLISVIIPVYNAENYLSCCLESLLRQTFHDFEVLLIDDGSKDASGKICDTYAEKDQRIHVCHKENGGVSSARNKGLDMAKGEWVTFMDADDWFSDRALEMYTQVELQPNTLYVQQAQTVIKGKFAYWPSRFKSCTLDLGGLADYEILNNILIYGTPWGKLYSMEVIKKNALHFDENISLHEDHCFYFDYINCIKEIVVMNEIGYYYRIEEKGNSLSSSGNIPSHDKLIYASNQLTQKLHSIIKGNRLDCSQLQGVLGFVFRIKIRALRSAFYYKASREERRKMLRALSPKDVDKYHIPTSISGNVLHMVLCCPIQCVRYAMLQIIRNKLNK